MKKWTLKQEHLPSIVACITILVLIAIKATNYRFPKFPWYPPVSWGLPKEIFIDPIILFVFPWKGWVFLIPLLVGLYYKSGYRILFSICVSTSITVGIVETFFNFSHYSVDKYVAGVMTYLFIYGTIFLIVIFIKLIFERIFK